MEYRFLSPVGTVCLTGDGVSLTSLTIERDCQPSDRGDSVWDIFLTAEIQLNEYFSGSRKVFKLPLSYSGTPFQTSVWDELQRIPYGETVTYGELAAAIGKPGAYRAVGSAVGKNPLSIIVPCHRVLAVNGLGGYAFGLDIKKLLLELESKNR
jgi:O-6-methylguanine DNA methyltransferase